MEDNPYFDPYAPRQAVGHGSTAQNPPQNSYPLVTLHRHPLPLPSLPYGWIHLPTPQPLHIPPNALGPTSATGVTSGSSQYHADFANSETPPDPHAALQRSDGIPPPGELPSQHSTSRHIQMSHHEHSVGSFPERLELSSLDAGQPSQAIGPALQYFPLTNPAEPLDASVTSKVSVIALNHFLSLLKAENWFKTLETEPHDLVKTNAFVVRGYVEVNAVSRFLWLIRQGSQGRFHCRIPHVTKGKPCDHNVLMVKDAIAHVREYFKYAPYQCLGDGTHEKCQKRFYTPERRHDHYSKKRTNPKDKVVCPHCAIKPMDKRNLERHIEKKHPSLPFQPA